MERISIVFATLLISITSCFAQIKAITEDGKNVLLHKDGTYSYVTNQSTAEEKNKGTCDDLITDFVDKMTKKAEVRSKQTLIVTNEAQDKAIGFFFTKSKTPKSEFINEYTVFNLIIKSVGAGNCVDNGDKINVLFTDGEAIEFRNQGKFNCESTAILALEEDFNKDKRLASLASKSIETIRMWTRNEYVEIDFKEDDQARFKNTLNCMAKAEVVATK